MSIRKKIFLFLITVLVFLALWQWELISYGLAQGKGQWQILNNSVPLEEVMARPDFPDSLKRRIDIIQQARKFAIDRLGLKPSDSYNTFYDQKGEVALWNVTACEPYSLTPKTWWFPIVGEVPYKGYFDIEKANRLSGELKDQGYDVRVRPVGGWSTLGWFNDPMLSSMLDRSTGGLAELIIHELTHGTVFVKDSVTFNENLASFIGEKGAVLFLKEIYGDSSAQLMEYLGGESDARKFTKHILRGTQQLDSLYGMFHSDMSDNTKKRHKQAMINQICQQLDTISFSNDRYKRIFDDSKPNNAYFMSFVTYYSFGDQLEKLYQNEFNADLVAFIAFVRQRHGAD